MQLARTLESLRQDPPHRRLERALRVGARTGIVLDWLPAGASLATTALRRGVGVHMLHAIHAAAHPDRPAMVDERRTVTYAEANAQINALANALRERFGVGRGARVMICMENRVEYLLTWFALFRLGAPAVHASFDSTSDELGYLLANSEAKVVICSERSREAVLAAAGDRVVLDADEGPGALSWHAVVAAGATSWPRRQALALRPDAESIVYTSGTTGRPKGAVRNFAAMGAAELSRILERLDLRAGQKHLVIGRLYHSGAQAVALIEIALGSTLYILPRFDPEETLRTMAEEGIHSVFMVPTMTRRLVELPAEVRARYQGRLQLRALVSGAAPFPHELRERACAMFGQGNVYDFYGATELGWVTLIDGHEMMARPGSVGRPIAGQQVRILDEAGRELPAGQVGTVYVRNAQTMIGYLGNDEATSETLREGWMTVEDNGYLDAQGYLYIAGRSRDMVISGGVNIYPVEIEECLLHHPQVADAAVVGVPDAQWGERLVAFVEPRGEAPEPEALEGYLRERLARFKVPRQWHFVEELPRNATGKVLKRALRERLT